MLSTIEEVVSVLGGSSAVGELAGVGTSAVSNWKARGKIPPEHFFALSAELKKHGERVAPIVFGAGK